MKKLPAIILFLHLTFMVHAQVETLSSPEAYFSAVIVENIDSSIEWYSKILGFSIQDKKEFPEMGFKQANLVIDENLLELIEMQTAVSLKEIAPDINHNTRLKGLFKIGYKVSDFDRWIKHFTEQNVNFHGDVVK